MTLAPQQLLLVLALLMTVVLTSPASPAATNLNEDYYEDDDDEDGPSLDSGNGASADPAEESYSDENSTETLGQFLGKPCRGTCSESLLHVYCSPSSLLCECDEKHPVRLGPTRGCTTPVLLGEQCLYQAACQHWEPHARCTQIQHNAICQCEPGFHQVSVHKRRVFCSADRELLTADLPTLLGVATGIALFAGIICFVLRLFVGAPPRDHFANANLAPAHILFSSETGSEISLRQLTAGKMALSLCRSGGSAGSGGHPSLPLTGRSQRSVSGSLSRGNLVPSSRAGAAHAAALLLMSCRQLAAADTDQSVPDLEDPDDEDDDDDEDSLDSPPAPPTSTPPPLTPVEPCPPAFASALSTPSSLSPLEPTVPAPPSSTPDNSPASASPAGSPSHRPGASTPQQDQPRTRVGPGSRRQSAASVHSSASSAKSMSFGMRRFEKEREQRLQRQQQLQQQRASSEAGSPMQPLPPQQLPTPGSASGDDLSLGRSAGTSPNPLSPMSTDKLLPALDQLVEDVVWTTQSSSHRPDHLMTAPGSSGYRSHHRSRQLHAHLSPLSPLQGAIGPCTSPDGR